MVIPSNVKSVEKRQSIRESWAKYLDAAGRCARCNSTRTVKILFGVGKADEADATGLELEQRAFGDVATLAEVGASQDNSYKQHVDYCWRVLDSLASVIAQQGLLPQSHREGPKLH